MNKKIYNITISGVFAALILVATLIAFPIAYGYANLGDCFVILAGSILGPVYGGLSAGIGSFLSDIILGYGIYAPATLVIKALMAVSAGLIFKAAKKNHHSIFLCAFLAEVIMLLGYFSVDSFLYGIAGATASLIGNSLQGITGFVTSVSLYYLLYRSKALKKINIK